MIKFDVHGKAKPAGSKRGFIVGKANGRQRVAIVDTSGKEGKIWRILIQDKAREAMENYSRFLDGDIKSPLIIAPVELHVKFVIKRPRHHYGSGKNSNQILERFRNAIPVSKPDSTKLLRAVEDALTGVIWRDDAQVYKQIVQKCYGDSDITYVTVIPFVKQDHPDEPELIHIA